MGFVRHGRFGVGGKLMVGVVNMSLKTYGLTICLLLSPLFLAGQSASSLVNRAKNETDLTARERLLTQAVTKSPQYALAWHSRADVYRAQGKSKQAIADYTKAIELTPKNPFRYYARALAYMDARKYSLAAADLTKALSLKKDYPGFYLSRAQVYMAQEKYTSAVGDYKKYLSFRRKTPAISLALAEAYIKTYKYSSAEKELNTALKALPDEPEGYFWRGRIRHNQGLLDEAVSYYSKALNRDGDFVPALRYRAAAFKEMGDLPSAAEDYTRLLVLAPEAMFYNRRGLAYEEMKEWDKALADYDKTIELAPKWSIGYNNRGYVYLKQKKYAAAREDFETAVKLDDALPTPYVNLAGLAWLQKKDRRGVYMNLEKALKRSFKDFESLYDEDRKGWMFKGINHTSEFRSSMYQ